MDFLKKITILGEFRLSYALLTMQYTFYNDADTHIACRYIFPVPEKFVIRDLQIMSEEKCILRADVQPVSMPEIQESGIKLFQLAPQIYCLQIDAAAGRKLQLQLQGVMSLQVEEAGYRFVFPLGFRLPEMRRQKTECCPVQFDLTVAPAPDTVRSVTHMLEIEKSTSATEVICFTEAGKDFVLDVEQKKPMAESLLRENMNEGIGVYRLCLSNPYLYLGKRRDSVWLLLDLSGIHSIKKANAVKELLYRTVEALPDDILIHIWCTSAKNPLFYGFRKEQSEEKIFSALEKAEDGKGSLGEMLQKLSAEEALKSEDLLLVFTGGMPAQPEAALNMREKLPAIHLVTTGTVENTAFSYRWKNGDEGEKNVHVHFYENEPVQSRIPGMLQRFLYPFVSPLITAEDGAVDEILADSDLLMGRNGYLDVAVRYTGQAPRHFALWKNGQKTEICSAAPSPVFRNLPMADALFGYCKTEQLKALLKKTDISSHRRIKQEMLETGLRFHMINSETVFAVADGEKMDAVPVVIYSAAAEGMEEYFDRPSIFGEEEAKSSVGGARKKTLVSYCKSIILDGIAGDGSITAPNVYGRQMRARQTAYSYLALTFYMTQADDSQKAALKQVLEDAESYLKSDPPKGIAGFLLDEKEEMQRKFYLHRQELHQMLPPVSELCARLKSFPNDTEAAACLLLRCFL